MDLLLLQMSLNTFSLTQIEKNEQRKDKDAKQKQFREAN
jgi:hypothetical protein